MPFNAELNVPVSAGLPGDAGLPRALDPLTASPIERAYALT